MGIFFTSLSFQAQEVVTQVMYSREPLAVWTWSCGTLAVSVLSTGCFCHAVTKNSSNLSQKKKKGQRSTCCRLERGLLAIFFQRDHEDNTQIWKNWPLVTNFIALHSIPKRFSPKKIAKYWTLSNFGLHSVSWNTGEKCWNWSYQYVNIEVVWSHGTKGTATIAHQSHMALIGGH